MTRVSIPRQTYHFVCPVVKPVPNKIECRNTGGPECGSLLKVISDDVECKPLSSHEILCPLLSVSSDFRYLIWVKLAMKLASLWAVVKLHRHAAGVKAIGICYWSECPFSKRVMTRPNLLGTQFSVTQSKTTQNTPVEWKRNTKFSFL